MRFPFGQIVATPEALAAFHDAHQSPREFLTRHARGDWGDLTPNDWQANEDALVHGSRLLSAYHLKTEVTIWILTEADRSITTLLLPSEY